VALILVIALTLAMVSSVTLPQWRARRALLRQCPRCSRCLLFEYGRNVLDTRSGKLDRFSDEGLGPLQWAFFSFLWCMGIAQQYQLFNWIDDRNYSLHYEVIEYQGDKPTRQVEPDAMFPWSAHGVLLQFYLHGITWMRIPPEREAELRSSLQYDLPAGIADSFNPGVKWQSTQRLNDHSRANRVEENRDAFYEV